KRSEMRPQWLVRPPSIGARHQQNFVHSPRAYGSPTMSQPPIQASNSPKGRSFVLAPRRGVCHGHLSIRESFALSDHPPPSSMTTLAPAAVRAWAAMPPPAPEPTMHTSYVARRGVCV